MRVRARGPGAALGTASARQVIMMACIFSLASGEHRKYHTRMNESRKWLVAPVTFFGKCYIRRCAPERHQIGSPTFLLQKCDGQLRVLYQGLLPRITECI
jgi:hypothetical protein